MAIVFDTYAAGFASDLSTNPAGTDATLAMTCSGQDRFAFLYVACRNNGTAPTGSTPTYGGVAMTKLSSNATTSNADCNDEVWYLVNPPVGANNFFFNMGLGFQASDQNLSAIGLNYTGVDPTAPLGTYGTSNVTVASNAAPQVLSVPLTGATGEVFVDFCCFVSASTNEVATVGAGQTERANLVGAANNRPCVSISDIPGAASISMERSITRVNAIVATLTAVPLKPAPTGKARALEYFYDIHSGYILDALGNRLQPWEIKPNRWIRVSGYLLPSGKKFASYTEDPEVAYIEEVAYTDRGVSIKTNRGELTEVLFARAAGGKTL